MRDMLTVRIRHEPGVVVVGVAGELDIATVPQLRTQLAPLVGGPQPVLVNLDRVSFLDCTALGALAGAANQATANGSSLHVICAAPRIRRLFNLTGLAGRLLLPHTMTEALSAMPATGQTAAGPHLPHNLPGPQPART